MKLSVYVPQRDSELREAIWPGSGIVGSKLPGTERFRIDFEGDSDVYPTYEERLRRAAERHLWSDGFRSGYPSRACAYVNEEELVRIGAYDPEAKSLALEAPDVLDAWLEGDEKVPGRDMP